MSGKAPTSATAAGKRAAIAVAAVAYLALTAGATLYGSAAIFMLLQKQKPAAVTADTTATLWDTHASDPKQRKRLIASIAIPPGLLLVVIPLAVLAGSAKRRELYGSARFANHQETRASGLLGGSGIVVGKYRQQFLALAGAQSVLLCAPTRSGKGVGVVIPTLLSWQDSVLVVDIKGENYRVSAGFRAAHGQRVYAWAPFADNGRSHRFNPLSYIRTEHRHVVADTLSIAQVLYPSDVKGSGTEAFFNDTARNLFLGLTLLLIETPELPCTLGELLRQSSGKGRPVKDYLQAVMNERAAGPRPLSDQCTEALMRFLATSDNTLSSILATFNAPLTVFSDPVVDASTSANDFALDRIRRERISVFVCIPPNRLADARLLLNLFFALAVNLNTSELPEDNPALKHQCLLVLDEFTALGRVNVLNVASGYLAGYGIRLLTVVQAVSQLESVYGPHDARSFATNHALQVMYAPREQRDANEYSEALGTFTQKEISRGRSNSSGARGGGSSQSRNESSQRRPLLLPQEFKELGTEREVIVLENHKPMLVDKIRYYQDPVLSARVQPPPPLPLIDLDTHRARVEQRTRLAEDDEEFSLDQVATSFAALPRLGPDASPQEVQAFIGGFFDALSTPVFSPTNQEPARAV